MDRQLRWEIILGQPDQTGQPSGGGLPEWTRNGSFMAFLQLQQHVTTFWSAMHKQAQLLGVKPDDVASWRSVVSVMPRAARWLSRRRPFRTSAGVIRAGFPV